MTAKEKKEYHRQLLALGRRLRAQLATLEDAALRKTGGEASGSLSNAPLHPADLGSDAFEQGISLSLLENDNQQLEEIGAAVERIKNGTFGRCEQCSGRISAERLKALPYARLCIDCARGAEQTALPGNL